MGRPEFWGWHSEYFLRDISIEHATRYARRMREFLEERYSSFDFLEQGFIEGFEAALGNSDPHLPNHYCFAAADGEKRDDWRVQFSPNQTSQLSFGIRSTLASEPIDRSVGVANALLDRDLAHVVGCMELRPKTHPGPLSRDELLWRALGNSMYVYVTFKIQAMPALLRQLRWQPAEPGPLKFREFLDRLESVFPPQTRVDLDLSVAEGVNGEENEREFLQAFDGALRCLPKPSLDQMFALIGRSADEWLNAYSS